MSTLLDPPRPASRRATPMVARRDDYGIDLVPALVTTDHAGPALAGARLVGDRYAGIDAIRGLAVLAVVAFHEGWLRGGFIAVDVFFVLSGFVITRLLLDPTSHSRSLATFWARRARRLLPAMLVLVAATQVWLRLGAPASQWRLLNGQSRAALGYASNWYAIAAGSGYWETGASKTALLHLWSLAVEEQFYVVWPLLIVGALRLSGGAARRWMAWATAALAAASLVWSPVVFVLWGGDRAYYGTDTRVGLILIGAALALWRATASTTGGKDDVGIVPARAGRMLVAASACWLFVALFVLQPHGAAFYFGGQAATGIAALVFVAAATSAAWPAIRVLSNRLLQWLGVRSYGMYLWSWPVHTVVTPDRVGLHGVNLFVLQMAALVTLALSSYHLVELPIRRGVLPGWRVMAAGAAAIATIATLTVVAQPDPPVQMTRGVLLTRGSGASSALRILVVGDSWGRSLGAGLVDADGTRDTILNDGIPACGVLGLPTRSDGKVRQVPADCAAWPTRWANEIATFDPDAVVLVSGPWDQAESVLGGRFVRPTDTAYQRRYARQLDRAIAVLSSGGAPVYVANMVDNARAADRIWSAAINRQLADAVERNGSARLLDLRRVLCPSSRCPTRLDGAAVYDDTHHLTATWQRRTGARVLALLRSEVGGSDERDMVRARQKAAAAVLPSARALTAPPDAQSSYPRPIDLAQELLPDAREERLALTALAGAIELRARDGSVVRAVGMRFGEDHTPDRLALAAVGGLEAEGWERVELAAFDRVVLVRGQDVRLLVRATNVLAVVEVHAPPEGATARARALVALADRLAAPAPK